MKTVYALGFFDGVHRGHQALLAETCRLAAREGARAGAVTFTAHPDALVLGRAPALLNTPADRERLLRRYGMEAILELPFDRAMMQTPWEAFLEGLPEAAGFVCGADFRFGAGGKGCADALAAFCAGRGLAWAVVPQVLEDGPISSTRIRALLEAGGMEEAVKLLGHPHILTGTVISGRQLGRTLGIPTANLALPDALAVPRPGVYACRARTAAGEHLAVTNVGSRPTVGGSGITVEPWLLDFAGDLYGQPLTLEFYRFLRPERKFPGLEELRREIQKNAAETRKFFDNP